MISPISNSAALYPSQALGATQLPATPPEASNLPAEPTEPTEPAEPPSTIVNVSDEAKQLLAAKTVTSAPIAVATVSDNEQVDQTAEAVYLGQQAQQQLETYAAVSQANQPPPDYTNPDLSGPDAAKAVALAAASENPQVDEFALAYAAAQQAQEKIDIYQEVAQNNQAQPPQSGSVV